MTCPHNDLCHTGDACAGHCRRLEQPMEQFYIAPHGEQTYLVERADDLPVPGGYVVARLA